MDSTIMDNHICCREVLVGAVSRCFKACWSENKVNSEPNNRCCHMLSAYITPLSYHEGPDYVLAAAIFYCQKQQVADRPPLQPELILVML
jgi:hypothetical protein